MNLGVRGCGNIQCFIVGEELPPPGEFCMEEYRPGAIDSRTIVSTTAERILLGKADGVLEYGASIAITY